MYYNTCPICGSNLDPGEHCTCGGEHEKIAESFADINGGFIDRVQDGAAQIKVAGEQSDIRGGTPSAQGPINMRDTERTGLYPGGNGGDTTAGV